MAEKNNAVCSICGNPYYACLSCKDKMKLHPYKIYCCSPSHFQVFQVVRGFSTGVYDKDEFKSKLKNIDLSDLESFREHIKVLIKDTLKEDSIEDSQEVKLVEAVKTNEYVDNAVKPIVSRRRNYKAEE